MLLFHGSFFSKYVKISTAYLYTPDQEAEEKSRVGGWGRRKRQMDIKLEGKR